MKKIIVCPNDFKKKRLSSLYNNKIINEDFYITLEQLREKMFFKIETEATLFARDYLNVKYSVAKSLMNNLYFLDNECDHENLNLLRGLKQELIKNNLIVFDNLFPFYLERYEVVVMGYLLSKSDMLLIEEVKKYTNVVIEDVEYKQTVLDVYSYSDVEFEIDNTFKKILSLINNNVKLSNIKFCNINSEYIHLIRRYSSFYDIKVNFKKEDSLLGSPIVNYFLSLYKTNKNLIEVIEILKEKYTNNDIIRKIVSLINDQKDLNKDLTDLFIYEFEKLKFDELRYDNAIEVVDFYNYEFSDDNHVFLLNFNNGAIPREFKDDQFLSDVITASINLDTTQDKIKLELESIKLKLYNIKNLYISYKLKTKNKGYTQSRLVNILNMNVIDNIDSNEYSNTSAKLNTAIKLEEFINYDVLDESIFKYYYLIENEFNSYKNNYNKVDVDLIKKRLDNKIKLSYTSLSTFYKCKFYYYLERILKINIDSGNVYSEMGTIFHDILENMNNDNYDYELAIKESREKFKSNKELFFYDKLSEEFVESLQFIKEMQECTNLTEELYEEQLVLTEKKLFDREFIGFVDKVIYKKINSKDYLAVIDYKTGNVSSSLNNVEYGFNLQLPIYAYMLKKNEKFKNPIVLGMFLQQILNKTPKYNSKMDITLSKKEDLKLRGFVIGDENLEILDKTYENSEMISKLKMNKNGTGLDRYSKVITEDVFDELADLVDKLIHEAFDEIEDVDFRINPKIIANTNESCMFCKYDSICYKTIKDNVYINNEVKEKEDGLD